MPYESERAYWRTLPEIVDHIGAVNGCDRDAARQQIRKALANGTLGPLRWEDPRPTPRHIGSATADLDDPRRRDPCWLDAEIDWDAGTVLEFGFLPEYRHLTRRRVLLVRRSAVAHLWPDRWKEEQAAERSRAMRRDCVEREFGKPGWSKWRIYSWIAHRDRSQICAIKNRSNLGGLQFYARPCVDRRPEETLLHALQADKLKAIDSGGKEIVADYWLGKEARDIGDVIFRRVDVLRVWPDPAFALEPPAQSSEFDQCEADLTRGASASHSDHQMDALGEGAKEPNTVPAVPLQTFVKHFVAREQEADRQPTQVRLEKAWHNAGRRGHRNELRITFNQQMAAAGKEVNVGRPKNSPRNSPK